MSYDEGVSPTPKRTVLMEEWVYFGGYCDKMTPRMPCLMEL